MILSVSSGEVKRGIQKSEGSPSLGKTDTPPRNVLASHEEIKNSMKGRMKGVIRYSLFGFVKKQVRRRGGEELPLRLQHRQVFSPAIERIWPRRPR